MQSVDLSEGELHGLIQALAQGLSDYLLKNNSVAQAWVIKDRINRMMKMAEHLQVGTNQ